MSERFLQQLTLVGSYDESHLLDCFCKLLAENTDETTLRILEINAGFGGTTRQLAEMLEKIDRPVEILFHRRLNSASGSTGKLFKVFMDGIPGLEPGARSSSTLQNKYDIVIGINGIHAASNIVSSTKRLRSLLKKGGFVVLTEQKSPVSWVGTS